MKKRKPLPITEADIDKLSVYLIELSKVADDPKVTMTDMLKKHKVSSRINQILAKHDYIRKIGKNKYICNYFMDNFTPEKLTSIIREARDLDVEAHRNLTALRAEEAKRAEEKAMKEQILADINTDRQKEGLPPIDSLMSKTSDLVINIEEIDLRQEDNQEKGAAFEPVTPGVIKILEDSPVIIGNTRYFPIQGSPSEYISFHTIELTVQAR